jgi:hypothetical protein
MKQLRCSLVGLLENQRPVWCTQLSFPWLIAIGLGLVPLLTPAQSFGQSPQGPAPSRRQAPQSLYLPGDLESAAPDALTARISDLVRRCRRPGSPGTQGGRPTAAEARIASQDFLHWKSEAERLLRLPNLAPSSEDAPSRQSPSGGVGASERSSITGNIQLSLALTEKHRLVQLYFINLLKLALVRADLSLPNGPAFTRQYALSVSEELAGMEFRFTPSRNSAPLILPIPSNQAFVVRPGPQGDYVLELSHQALAGIEVLRLSEDPTGPQQLRLVQMVAVNSLLRTLSEVRAYRSGHSVRRVQFAPAFTEALREYGALDALENEGRLLERELSFRLNLVEQISSQVARLPDPVDPSFVLEFLNVTGARINNSAVVMQLRESLARPSANELSDSILVGNVPLSPLTQAQISAKLRKVIADTVAARFFGAVARALESADMDESGRETAPDLEILPNAFNQGADLAQRYFDRYAASISSEWLEQVVADACGQLSSTNVFEVEAQKLVNRLVSDSLRFSEQAGSILNGSRVDPNFVWSLFEEELTTRGVRHSLLEFLKRAFLRSESMAEVRAGYYSGLVHFFGMDAIDWRDGSPVLNRQRAENFLRTHDFSPPLVRPNGMSQAMHDERVRVVRDARIAELRAYLWLGDQLRLDRPVPSVSASESGPARLSQFWQTVTVANLFDTQARRDAYGAQVRSWMTGQNHLLLTRVSYPGGERPLAEALLQVHSGRTGRSSQRTFLAARALVDQALTRVESSTLEAISRITSASSLQALLPLLRGQGMQRLITERTPEISESISRFVIQSLAKDPLTLAVESLIGKVGNPQLAILATQLVVGGTHWAVRRLTRSPGPNPWLAPISMGLASTMGAFVEGTLGRAIMGLFVADIGYQSYEFYHRELEPHGLTEVLIESQVTQRASLLSQAEADRENARFRMASMMFAGVRSLDAVAFLGIPMGLHLAERASAVRTASGGRIAGRVFAEDLVAFESLGIRAGHWEEIPTSLDAFYSRYLTGSAGAVRGGGVGDASLEVAAQTLDRLRAWVRLQQALAEGNSRLWNRHGVGHRRIARERLRIRAARSRAAEAARLRETQNEAQPAENREP